MVMLCLARKYIWLITGHALVCVVLYGIILYYRLGVGDFFLRGRNGRNTKQASNPSQELLEVIREPCNCRLDSSMLVLPTNLVEEMRGNVGL